MPNMARARTCGGFAESAIHFFFAFAAQVLIPIRV
jgi:hypothetical protein